MSLNINRVELAGRLTKDLVNVSKDEGKCVVPFTLAIKKKYTEGTDFILCVAYGKTGENLLKYCGHKGSEIHMFGRLCPRTFEDNDNNKKYVVDIVADEIQYVIAK